MLSLQKSVFGLKVLWRTLHSTSPIASGKTGLLVLGHACCLQVALLVRYAVVRASKANAKSFIVWHAATLGGALCSVHFVTTLASGISNQKLELPFRNRRASEQASLERVGLGRRVRDGGFGGGGGVEGGRHKNHLVAESGLVSEAAGLASESAVIVSESWPASSGF